jgi:3'(2'), 5'-bisphosphate nucleotidase
MRDYLNIAINAAIQAGNVIMDVYQNTIAVSYKEDNSPLTEADRKAGEIINNYLEQTNIPVINEENKQLPYEIRKNWGMCWIVDPLDGTKEFIKRNGEFTVNIALIKNKKPIMGVIYVPVTNVLYFTNETRTKAFKTKIDTPKKSIDAIIKDAAEIHPVTKADSLLKIVGSRSHLNEDTLAFINNLKKEKPVEIVSVGSSLKFCLVASGNAHIYPRFAPTMEWDTAAGQAICEAVGVSVLDYNTKKPLLYNKENLLNPYFLVKPSNY